MYTVNRFTEEFYGSPRQWYTDMHGKPTPFPGSLVLQVRENIVSMDPVTDSNTQFGNFGESHVPSKL